MSARPTNKILIVLPFWPGDRAKTLRTAQFLAHLEPQKSSLADLLFVARFDCIHDNDVIRTVAKKFNCYTHVSARKETGWPYGCNGLFFGAMEYVYHMMEAGKIPHYKAVFICEGDTIPLQRDWIARLHKEWDSRKVTVAGALVPHESHPHINGGCCLLSGNLKFLKWLVKIASGNGVCAGWDWFLAADFSRWGWADIPGIQSIWNTATFSREEIKAQIDKGTFILHGCKDYSALKHSMAIIDSK